MNTENTQLCPNCKTGRDSYLLDGKEPFCPYIYLNNGSDCTMYKNLEVTE